MIIFLASSIFEGVTFALNKPLWSFWLYGLVFCYAWISLKNCGLVKIPFIAVKYYHKNYLFLSASYSFQDQSS